MSTEESESFNNGREKKDSFFTKPSWPSSRRTPSLSSSSSSLSSSSNSSSSFRSSTNELSPPPSPEGGIPFSWESIPGIPKNQLILKNMDSHRKSNHLPLPPAAIPVSTAHKKNIVSATRKDPFFAALVECSKVDDDDAEGPDNGRIKFNRTFPFSDRLGFGALFCKNASAVTESLVFIPRVPRRIAYDKVNNRSG